MVVFTTNEDELHSLLMGLLEIDPVAAQKLISKVLMNLFESDPVAAQKLVSKAQLNSIKSLKKKVSKN